MNKILCIGEALMDMICTDTGMSLAEGSHFLKKTGGAPMNVAAAVAALGGKVMMASKVGSDPFGQQLIDEMKNFGVDTDCMLKDPLHFTTLAFVSLMENGERDFVFSRGADGQLNEAEIEGINLDDIAIIHFGSATGFLTGPLQAAYKRLLDKALMKNIFISFDPNYRHLLFKNNTQSFIDQSWYFLQHCNFFKVSDEEAMLLTGTDKVETAALALLDKTKAVFTITLGKDGTMLGYNGATFVIPSIAVKPVDTTGAGDAFVGAALYLISKMNNKEIAALSNEKWMDIVANANKAGARTCEYLGAMEAFKHLSSAIFE